MLTALAALLLACPPADPALTRPPLQGDSGKPRLVVLIAVDQLVPEQLHRLESRLEGGFARFLREGTNFWRATIDYAVTETGPGHATFATGRWPSGHGVVGNLYIDRASRAQVYCVGDAGARTVTSVGPAAGPGSVSGRNMVGPALGDLLRARTPGTRIVALSGKDRSAALLGGHDADDVLWWDGGGTGFASSSAYGDALPDFARVWNEAWKDRARGWKWSASPGADDPRLGTAPDVRAGESSLGGAGLPRTLPSGDTGLSMGVLLSPLIDLFTLELATLALETRELGRDDDVDVLGISLSGCDYLGHSYGPWSVEVTDLLLRVDQQLGRFLEQLDRSVGKGRWVAVLTSDHGVLDLPEGLRARQVGARRVQAAELAELDEMVASVVSSVLGDPAALGLRRVELGFDFDPAAAEAAGIDPVELRALIAEAAVESPLVASAYTLEQIEGHDGDEDDDPWLELYRRNHHPERCMDVVLRPEPWLFFGPAEGTGHGSPYPYDRRVPLAFLGPGVAARARFDAASPTDAVPTVLGLLGIEPPAELDGRVLELD